MNVAIVRALLARGADPSLQSEQHMTPLDIAREHGHSEIVALFERDATTQATAHLTPDPCCVTMTA